MIQSQNQILKEEKLQNSLKQLEYGVQMTQFSLIDQSNQIYKQKKQKHLPNIAYLKLIILLTVLESLPIVSPQNCLKFLRSKCIECPKGAHLYNGDCYFDIPFCIKHINGVECAVCQDNYISTGSRLACVKQNKNQNLIEEKNYKILFSQLPDPKYSLLEKVENSLRKLKFYPPVPPQPSNTNSPMLASFNSAIVFTEIPEQYFPRHYSQQLINKIKKQKQFVLNDFNLPVAAFNSLKVLKMYKGAQNAENIQNLGSPYRAILGVNNSYIQILFRINQTTKSQKYQQPKSLFEIQKEYKQLKNIQLGIYKVLNIIQSPNIDSYSKISQPYKLPQVPDIKNYLVRICDKVWPKLKQTQIFSLYLNQNIQAKKYILYLVQKDFGMVQVQLTLNTSIYAPTLNTYPQSLLNRNQNITRISKLVQAVKKSDYFIPYFQQNAVLASVIEQVYDNNFIAYRAKYLHMTKDQNQSSFLFNYNPIQQTINVKRSDLFNRQLQKYEIAFTNQLINVFSKVFPSMKLFPDTTPPPKSSKINQKVFLSYPILSQVRPPSSLQPRNIFMQLPTSTQFNIQYVQITKLRKFVLNPIYASMIQFIQRIQNNKKAQGMLYKINVKQNNTYTIYQLTYRIQKQQNEFYLDQYRVGCSKFENDKKWQFLEYNTNPYKQIINIKLDDKNRQQTIKKLPYIYKQLLKFIKNNETEYNENSKLLQITTKNYIQSQQQLTPQKIHTFKFYYPPKLNKNYQFIQFRYAELFKDSVIYVVGYGHVVTPKENFSPVSAKYRSIILNFLQYVNVQNQGRIGDYQLLECYSSIDRPYVNRIGLLIDKKDFYLCEVDQQFSQQYLILQISQIRERPIPTRTPPSKYSNFPTKNKQDNWTIPTPTIIRVTTVPSNDDVKKMIDFLFYNGKINDLDGVATTKQQTMMGIYDRFEVQFADTLGLYERKYRLVFQIQRVFNRSKIFEKQVNQPQLIASTNQSLKATQIGRKKLLQNASQNLPGDIKDRPLISPPPQPPLSKQIKNQTQSFLRLPIINELDKQLTSTPVPLPPALPLLRPVQPVKFPVQRPPQLSNTSSISQSQIRTIIITPLSPQRPPPSPVQQPTPIIPQTNQKAAAPSQNLSITNKQTPMIVPNPILQPISSLSLSSSFIQPKGERNITKLPRELVGTFFLNRTNNTIPPSLNISRLVSTSVSKADLRGLSIFQKNLQQLNLDSTQTPQIIISSTRQQSQFTSDTSKITYQQLSDRTMHNNHRYFIHNPYGIKPIAYYAENQFIHLDILPLKEPKQPSQETLDLVNVIFNYKYNVDDSELNIQIQSQRQSLPTILKVIDITVTHTGIGSSNTKTKLRIWIIQPNNRIVKIQARDDGSIRQYKQIDPKLFQDNKFLSSVESIARGQVINTINAISSGSQGVFGQQAGDYASNVQIDYRNIVYMRQKIITNLLLIQLFYQLPEIIIKIAITSKKSQQDQQELNILSTTLHANGLKQLREDNYRHRMSLLDILRKQYYFAPFVNDIVNRFGKFQNEDVVDASVRFFNNKESLLLEVLHIFNNTQYFSQARYDLKKKVISNIIHDKYLPFGPQSRGQKKNLSNRRAGEASVQLIKGCSIKILGLQQCVKCKPQYYLSKDKQCYPALPGCQIQSGILCILCRNGYIDNGNFGCQ